MEILLYFGPNGAFNISTPNPRIVRILVPWKNRIMQKSR